MRCDYKEITFFFFLFLILFFRAVPKEVLKSVFRNGGITGLCAVLFKRFTAELFFFHNLMEFMLHTLCARLCTKYFTNTYSPNLFPNLHNSPIIILIGQVRKRGAQSG